MRRVEGFIEITPAFLKQDLSTSLFFDGLRRWAEGVTRSISARPLTEPIDIVEGSTTRLDLTIESNVVCYNNAAALIYMPTAPQDGHIIRVKRRGGAVSIVYTSDIRIDGSETYSLSTINDTVAIIYSDYEKEWLII